MLRIYKLLALLCVAGSCHAQSNIYGPVSNSTPGAALPQGMGVGEDFRNSKSVDPKAVEIPLYAGAQISAVLTALTDKGFKIRWKPEQVTDEMKIVQKPKSTRVDNMLNEILEPWGLRVDADLMKGGYLVKDMKKKKSKEFAVEQNSTS